MQILIANIGNRNIKYKGQLYSEHKSGDSFRDWSRDLLDNYGSVEQELELNILNPLLEQKDNRFDHIYLVFSDQSKINGRIDQDTLYEAKIIKLLLTDKYLYSEDQIHLVHCRSGVIDNKELMRFYRSFLHKVTKKDQFDMLTICDAGGTAQQKMALKIMAEFILPEDKYKVVYAMDNKIIKSVDVDEYRSVINNEICSQLLKKGNINAVLQLLDIHAIEIVQHTKNWKHKLIAHLFFRFAGNYPKAKDNLTGKEHNDILKSYYDQEVPEPCFSSWLTFSQYINVTDHLRLANFHMEQMNYSQSVLSFARFYEALFQINAEKVLDKEKYGKIRSQSESQRSAFRKMIMEKFGEEFRQIKLRYAENSDLRLEHLATQSLLLKMSNSKELRKLEKIIGPHIQFSYNAIANEHVEASFINTLRNQIAHSGLFLTHAMITGDYAFYPALLKQVNKTLKLKYPNAFADLIDLVDQIIFRS